MDTKKELKKGTDLHSMMDKILAKFKMTKHGGEEKQTESKTGKSLRESNSRSSADFKLQTTWSKSKVTPERVIELSEHLQQLLEHIQAVKEFILLTNDFPERLSKRLDEEAIELRELYRYVQETALDVERLQKHRYLIKKEKLLASKKLDKLREEEIQELESIIYAYAKPLHSKWESIKNSQKMDVVENFMNEVTGKHRAIEILQELVRRKLAKMTKKIGNAPFTLQKHISSTNMNNKSPQQDKNISPWNVTPVPNMDRFNQTIDKVTRGPTDRDILKMNRRKRQKLLREERRRANNENSSSSNADNNSNNNNNNGGLELHLVPIDHFRTEDAEDDLSVTKPATEGNRTSPVINIEFMYDTDSVSMSSSDFTLENFSQSGNPEPQQELQREMRTVLQALFRDIRHIPQMRSYPNRSRYNGTDFRPPRTGSN